MAAILFTGRRVYLDGRERGLRPLLTSPVLLLTVLFGPFGLAAYLGLRRSA